MSGRFSSPQRDVYDIVHAAQVAALATIKPGVPLATTSAAAHEVLTDGLKSLGLLRQPGLAHLSPEQAARRWTLHPIGHMLGADVHDAAVISREYRQQAYEVGHYLTIEPGLYFSPHDEWVPEVLRGIGVRIEDDVLVTDGGIDVLTAGLPTAAPAVEAWLEQLA